MFFIMSVNPLEYDRMFKIRTPNSNDLKKLSELSKDNPVFEQVNKSPANMLGFILQSLIPSNLRLLPSIHIAIERNKIIGYIILKSLSKPNNSWQIDEVFVIDEMRNEGVGEELLRYALSVYGGYGIEHFLAEINSQNTPALSLFHQCGFRRYAKVYFYEREIDSSIVETFCKTPLPGNDFILRPQTKNDLIELEKLEISSVPPDLRIFLGKSKEYFKQRKDSIIVIDKSRGLVIGWARVERFSDENYLIELLASPGWTHLYEQFLNTIICDYISFQTNKIKLTVKAVDYLTELSDTLKKTGFLPFEIKELLVRTVWNKVKERKSRTTKLGSPSIAPT